MSLSGAVLCFGHFNTIHPGHIRYFRTARQYGEQLVVGLEGDAQPPESERGKVFSEWDRAQAVAALDLVDYVVILDTGSLADLVGQIMPVALVLGKEFETARAVKVTKAVSRVRSQGGKVLYDAGETHYATADLFHDSPNELEKERWRVFQSMLKTQQVSLPKVFDRLAKNKPSRVLVLGDTIVDRYVACDPVGMSNEAPVVVVKELETRDYVGGAGIVAAHTAALGAECTYLSVTGGDNSAKFVASELASFGVETCLLEDLTRPTTFKIRYLVANQKLFRVSRLKEHAIAESIENDVIERIREMAPDLDGIVVSDFVYGLITPRIIDTLKMLKLEHNLALFGDLQCSSQVGKVTKFKDFSLLCPTEREARLALDNHDDGVEYVANLMLSKTNSSYLLMKLGADGFIGYSVGEQAGFSHRQHFPALTVNPLDVMGAGDALLATVSVGLTQGLSLIEASALGCCVSAIVVQTLGNRPVRLEQVKEFVNNRDMMIDVV
jgi:rfaE bifunctional protein kinase chain/domain